MKEKKIKKSNGLIEKAPSKKIKIERNELVEREVDIFTEEDGRQLLK